MRYQISTVSEFQHETIHQVNLNRLNILKCGKKRESKMLGYRSFHDVIKSGITSIMYFQNLLYLLLLLNF